MISIFYHMILFHKYLYFLLHSSLRLLPAPDSGSQHRHIVPDTATGIEQHLLQYQSGKLCRIVCINSTDHLADGFSRIPDVQMLQHAIRYHNDKISVCQLFRHLRYLLSHKHPSSV